MARKLDIPKIALFLMNFLNNYFTNLCLRVYLQPKTIYDFAIYYNYQYTLALCTTLYYHASLYKKHCENPNENKYLIDGLCSKNLNSFLFRRNNSQLYNAIMYIFSLNSINDSIFFSKFTKIILPKIYSQFHSYTYRG